MERNVRTAAQIYYDVEKDVYRLDDFPLQRGNRFEILAYNPQSGLIEWIAAKLDYREAQWCLSGMNGYNLDGLYARGLRR